MARAEFRFHAELNFFLPPRKRQVWFTHCFKDRPSIKDAIESLGVPHPEVEAILVNGEGVNFSYILQDSDRVEVYPISLAGEVEVSTRVRPHPPSSRRFVLDIHLGKLANALRLLGFDTLYRNDYTDEELAEISAREQRTLLTRDKGLLMRSKVTYGYYVRATNPEPQVVEVLHRFDLFEQATPFQRCIRCNGLLEPVDKDSILERLPPRTRDAIDEFHRCQSCGQIYWQGSHYERMKQFTQRVLQSGGEFNQMTNDQ
jgi:hypothetical protein